MKQAPEIYFHVGLGKTGTTFLQYRVFPYLKGVNYIQRTKYKRAIPILKKGEHDKYFLSREFDQQLETEVKKFSAEFPDTRTIIVFRKHDSYIASQYRRFVKNGFRLKFTEFIDLEKDQGYFKKSDLDYMRQVKILEEHFNHPPLVLIYDDMRKDPKAFFTRIANYMGASIDIDSLNLSRLHSSYSEKQLKGIYSFGKYVNLRKRRVTNFQPLHYLWRFYMSIMRYSTLFICKLLPKSFFSKKPLIDPEELERVGRYFEEDWNSLLSYAKRQVN